MLTQTAPLPHVTSGAVVLHHQCKDYPLPWTMDLSEVTRLRMDFSERVETNVVVCRRILGIFSHQSVRWCVESMRFDGYIYIYTYLSMCPIHNAETHLFNMKPCYRSVQPWWLLTKANQEITKALENLTMNTLQTQLTQVPKSLKNMFNQQQQQQQQPQP